MTGLTSLYLNGDFKTSFTKLNVSQPSLPLSIGGFENGLNPEYFLFGSVDELGLWNRVLTPEEVFTLYNLGNGRTIDIQATPAGLITPAVPQENLLNYWKLDEASGTRIDSIGNNSLVSTNSVGSTAGLTGNHATFNGSDQYLSTPWNIPTGSFSISFWCGGFYSKYINQKYKCGGTSRLKILHRKSWHKCNLLFINVF